MTVPSVLTAWIALDIVKASGGLPAALILSVILALAFGMAAMFSNAN